MSEIQTEDYSERFNWEGSACFKALSWHLPEMPEENHEAFYSIQSVSRAEI
jgi:hypothetical protein